MHNIVRRRGLMLTAVAGMSLLGACQDKRLKAVDTGMSRDSLLTVIGTGAPGVDSLPNVYQRERYLINGKNFEILFFSPTGRHAYMGTEKDTIPWKDLTPIAMIDNRVMGKGYAYLDSLYAANKIPVKPK